MSDMSFVLSSHNLNVINPYKTQTCGFNCRTKESCLLQNQCLTSKIIYGANVENDINNETKFYFGLLKHHLKNDFEIILEILSIKRTLKVLDYPNTYGI